ncbi:tripartite tricarboxylate transporter permease [Salirhabdus salicampi]|uniref:tripartite tricarboxylate transporter permease n=1 Tax=Salirhabdus salicampi TaxID=476102 RepID=UPI0020C30382|nr:tripartite tricarboxylate transporter permease [Salirhabdus salicampi]MCP8616316.1 tripartite tricarboxylate transporter permease [Salirhabdus salicampi]
MFQAAADALMMVADPVRLAFMFLGIGVGLIIGLLPGLGGTVGMSILLPFIFGMDPYTGMALLIGMAAVVHTGDTFPSVLLGIPGSSGSQATIMDGYPLAKKGKAATALSAAFFSSMVGGVIGAFVLFLAIPIARPLVLAFGSPELFMMSMLGLSMVGILAGNSPIKGVTVGIIGLLIGSIGAAPAVPEYRYVFDNIYLYDGIPLAVLALGLFAFPEMVDLLAKNNSISRTAELKGSWLDGIKASIKNKWLLLRSSVLGSLIGFIPGLGGSVVDWITYGVAKSTVRNNEFGKGDIRGVIAPEGANNAKEGGALIPALLFSIPGSGTTAMLLGGIILLGFQAGPTMVTTNLPITLSIIWTLVLANIFGAIACIFLSKYIAKLSMIPATKLVPFLLIILVIGAYQSTRSFGDLVAFIVIGLLGWVLKRLDWPRAPLLIGFVLSLSAERYLWISMSRYGFEWLQRPSVIILVIVILILLAGGIFLNRTSKKSQESGGITS